MNFLEMLDSLPLEQKKPFVDHFVNTVLGNTTDPLMMPRTMTLNNDLELAKKIKLMEENYGIDPDSMDWISFLSAEEEINKSKSAVMEIIKDHYNQNFDGGQRSKNDEILDLGKFLYTTNLRYKFIPGELPDFILAEANRSIGVEHTRLQHTSEKAYISEILKKYINPVVQKIIIENPALTGLINVTLDMDFPLYDGMSLRNFKTKAIKKNHIKIIESMASYIMGLINGEDVPTPKIFKSISYQSGEDAFAIRYNQEYFARTDFENSLITAIQKKELRLDAYKSNVLLNEWWLLIVIDYMSLSSGFSINENSLNSVITSKFDRVIILNSFDLACYEIKQKKPYMKYIAEKQFPVFHVNRKR